MRVQYCVAVISLNKNIVQNYLVEKIDINFPNRDGCIELGGELIGNFFYYKGLNNTTLDGKKTPCYYDENHSSNNNRYFPAFFDNFVFLKVTNLIFFD